MRLSRRRVVAALCQTPAFGLALEPGADLRLVDLNGMIPGGCPSGRPTEWHIA